MFSKDTDIQTYSASYRCNIAAILGCSGMRKSFCEAVKLSVAGAGSESSSERVGSRLRLYRWVFLNQHPLPYSLLLHFLSRSLRKPFWLSFLPAHRADSEGINGMIALRRPDSGARDVKTARLERERERKGGDQKLFRA